MKFRVLSAAALVCALACAAAAQGDKAKQGEQPKISGGERDAAVKIEKAQGAEAKLQAAAAFLKKYPQSSIRRQIAEGMANEIANVADAQQKASLAQAYTDIFNLPEEAALINPTLLGAYIGAGRTEDALKLGTDWLAKHPEDVQTLENLTILASNEAIKGNTAYAAQGREYGTKAIGIIESDKMPEGFDAAKWAEFKSKALPTLYRSVGLIAYKTGDRTGALPLLEKVTALNAADPGVYVLISELNNDVYDLRAKEYQVASEAEKPAALKRAETALDKVIDSYAQAIAATEGSAQYQQVNVALRQDLERYYVYRHKNTEGMQQLIDKYKKPAQ